VFEGARIVGAFGAREAFSLQKRHTRTVERAAFLGLSIVDCRLMIEKPFNQQSSIINHQFKTGDVTLAEVLTFANKLERTQKDAIGILFVLSTIYPDALTAAKDRNIEVWDIARINTFRGTLGLEKLAI
jgi:hypothetical protein